MSIKMQKYRHVFMCGLVCIHKITSPTCSEGQSNDTPITMRPPDTKLLVSKHYIQIKDTRVSWRNDSFQGWDIINIKWHGNIIWCQKVRKHSKSQGWGGIVLIKDHAGAQLKELLMAQTGNVRTTLDLNSNNHQSVTM